MTRQPIENQTFSACTESAAMEDRHYLNCQFTDMDWQGASLKQVKFEKCRFERVRFRQCSMEELLWLECTFQQVAWLDCSLSRSNLMDCSGDQLLYQGGRLLHTNWNKMKGRDWKFDQVAAMHCIVVDAVLAQVRLQAGEWRDCIWAKAHIDHCAVEQTRLLRHVFAECQLEHATWHGCAGSNVRWTGCTLQHFELLDCDLPQLAWSKSRCSDGVLRRCTLPNACFDNSVLQRLQWVNCSAPMALFDGATLTQCDFSRLQAPGLSLRCATLKDVSLRDAQIERADACGARLNQVDLQGAHARGSRLLAQRRKQWAQADTEGSVFEVREEFKDAGWWRKYRPGVREVLA